ncbi:MAG TPA: glycine cleavage T C-terminal barrel domain-containing protein [Solirubrobacterales bacterium]|nr:glycine cleavage T C-terminal barrel domain-containing protein [Solirubrobacterales bacterium]
MAESGLLELDAQYRQLREECGLLDRSARGKLLASGPEAAEYLQGQLTNDVEGLAPGDGHYAALLDRKGHMQADMRVLRLAPEEVWIDTEPEALGAARRHLEMYKIGRDVEVADLTAERAILSLIGPQSAAVAGTAALPEHAAEPSRIGGVDCIVVGTPNGLDLIAGLPDSQSGDLAGKVERLREALVEAGAVEVGPEAAEILRIESGTPRFGAEMSTETMPAEAGIVEAAVDFTKGCYIGQEPVARLHYKGRPNRHLRGLELSAPAEPGTSLRLGEKEVGRVGSACVSPAHGPIALAIVRREAEPGAELAVGEDDVTARVVDLPFG